MTEGKMVNSHHGDPALSQIELDTCLKLIKWIEENRPNDDLAWLPPRLRVEYTYLLDWYGFGITEQELKTVNHMLEWIKIARNERHELYPWAPYWLPNHVDMLKSRLFWRLRSGKAPLPSPPPTAFSCPWYELIEQPERAHWAYDCYIHKPGEDGLWGNHSKPIANIGQCMYEVLTWSDKDETIPFSVSFGPYIFRTFLGPFETHQYNHVDKTMKVITLQGWWIKYIPNPTVDGAFDLEIEELPYKIGQSRD